MKCKNYVSGSRFVVSGLGSLSVSLPISLHDDAIKWKHFPRYWPFVRGNQRFRGKSAVPVISPHMFSLICVWTNGWVNNREAGELRRHRGHYDVIVMQGDFNNAGTLVPLVHLPNPTMQQSHIPQCTTCTFCCKMVHYGIFVWCTERFVG